MRQVQSQNRTRISLRKVLPLFLFIGWNFISLAQVSPDTIKIERETQVFDTVFIQDTIRITDTIFEEQFIYKSIGISTGTGIPILQYPNMGKEEINANRSLLSNHLSFQSGIDLKLDFEKLSMSIGAQYAFTSSEFNNKSTFWNIDSTSFFVTDSTLRWEVDTIDFYLQEVEGDTITVYVTDSSQNWDVDSSLNYTTDSTQSDSIYKFNNLVRQINIPIILHKPLWITENHVLYGSAGLVGSFILKENIAYLSDNEIQKIHSQSLQFRTLLLVGISWEQYIGDYFSLEVHSNYLFNPLPSQIQYSSFQFNVLLRYYF